MDGALGTQDRLILRLLETVDTNLLSRLLGRLAALPLPAPMLRVLAERFAAHYGADLSEMADPLSSFRTFDQFFTRRLREGARPIAPGHLLVSPCDGTIGACGVAREGELLQAKGHPYTLAAFVGSDAEAARLAGGRYWTIYLAPRNYHRVHSPCGAVVDGFVHLPGPLFPVNAFGVRAIDGLFERNERVVTLLTDGRGRRLALVMVGAYGVGSIELLYERFRSNRRGANGESRRYAAAEAPRLAPGDELGIFHLGSTVVLLTEPGFEEGLDPKLPPSCHGAEVRTGEPLALPAP